jgi:hypothetical protein
LGNFKFNVNIIFFLKTENSDIFNVNLGLILPSSHVIIVLKYITELPVFGEEISLQIRLGRGEREKERKREREKERKREREKERKREREKERKRER